MIGVVVADDHPVVRAGVVGLLAAAADIEVVAVACDGAEAVAAVADHSPDVVIMDLAMPNVCGAEATRRILESRPGTRILIFTAFPDRTHVDAALDAGAAGVVMKDADPATLLDAVRLLRSQP